MNTPFTLEQVGALKARDKRLFKEGGAGYATPPPPQSLPESQMINYLKRMNIPDSYNNIDFTDVKLLIKNLQEKQYNTYATGGRRSKRRSRKQKLKRKTQRKRR